MSKRTVRAPSNTLNVTVVANRSKDEEAEIMVLTIWLFTPSGKTRSTKQHELSLHERDDVHGRFLSVLWAILLEIGLFTRGVLSRHSGQLGR